MSKVEKSPVVVQSNRLVESRYTLTVGEQRLIFAMASMIHPDDVDFFPYEIKISDLALVLNIDLKNAYREADAITDRLMERVLHIPEKEGLLKIGWVSSCRYNQKRGTISFKFDPDLKPYLLRLKKEFTKSKLTILTQFQSIYSIRIYQLLKQYKNIGYREFSVEELKEILGIKKEEYREFKRFRGRVLNQAKKEFEKKTKAGFYQCDFTFKLETIREGRKIARVKFIIIPQTYQEYLPFSDSPIIEEKEEKRGTRELLKFYGISDKQARGFLNDLGEERVGNILEYYAERLDTGQVKNEGGAYLAKLLKEGIVVKAPHEKQKETVKAEEQEIIQQKQKAKKIAEEEQERVRSEKEKKIDEILNQITKQEILILNEEYKSTFAPVVQKSLEKHGPLSQQFRYGYYNFLANKFNLASPMV